MVDTATQVQDKRVVLIRPQGQALCGLVGRRSGDAHGCL